MKVENLQVGQVFKNYKALCETLDEPVKGGKSKKIHLDDMSRYFEYSKSGHNFVINKVYEEPIEKIDGRRNSIYGNAIQLLITDLLARSEGYLTISKNKLMVTVGMINVNYGECSQQVNNLAKYTEMDKGFIYDFYNINNSNLTGILETALDNLKDKSILMYNDVIKLCEQNSSKTRAATKSEVTYILECEKEVLNELGFENKSKIRISNKWNIFKKLVQSKLKNDSNIDYYYNAYEIIINKKYIEQERKILADLLLEQVAKDETKSSLNSTIIDQFIHNSKIRGEKGFTAGKKLSQIRTSKDYIENMKQLASILIDKNTARMTGLIMNPKEDILPKEIMDQVEQILLFD